MLLVFFLCDYTENAMRSHWSLALIKQTKGKKCKKEMNKNCYYKNSIMLDKHLCLSHSVI